MKLGKTLARHSALGSWVESIELQNRFVCVCFVCGATLELISQRSYDVNEAAGRPRRRDRTTCLGNEMLFRSHRLSSMLLYVAYAGWRADYADDGSSNAATSIRQIVIDDASFWLVLHRLVHEQNLTFTALSELSLGDDHEADHMGWPPLPSVPTVFGAMPALSKLSLGSFAWNSKALALHRAYGGDGPTPKWSFPALNSISLRARPDPFMEFTYSCAVGTTRHLTVDGVRLRYLAPLEAHRADKVERLRLVLHDADEVGELVNAGSSPAKNLKALLLALRVLTTVELSTRHAAYFAADTRRGLLALLSLLPRMTSIVKMSVFVASHHDAEELAEEVATWVERDQPLQLPQLCDLELDTELGDAVAERHDRFDEHCPAGEQLSRACATNGIKLVIVSRHP